MRERKPTKERLIIEAFKLFASKPYDRVTFTDLELATGLSRGAILYHIKTKENLFFDVVKKFIFEHNSVSRISEKDQSNLKNFIESFISVCRKEKKELKNWEIDNINIAMLNIECSAFFVFPRMQDIAYEWFTNETKTWEKVIYNAITSKEIQCDINVTLWANLFESVYLGSSFKGIANKLGYDIEQMEHEFFQLYKLLVKR